MMGEMDFETLRQGFYSLVVAAVSSVLMPALLPSVLHPLKQGEIIESFNLTPQKNYDLEPPVASDESHQAEEQNDSTDENVPAAKVEEATSATVVTVDLPPPEKPVHVAKMKPEKPNLEKEVTVASEEKKAVKQSVTDEIKKLSPLSSPSSSPRAVPILQKLTGGAEKLFQMVNSHRKELGLPVFETDEKICQIARDRAPQIRAEVFGKGPIHKGFKALNLSYWATENAAAYDTIEQNFKFWMADSIHKKAIEGPSKYSCAECSGTACSQIFTSFIPK